MTLKEDIKKILDDYQPRTPSEITKELKKEHAVKSGVNYVSTLLREIVEESNQYFLLQDKVYQKGVLPTKRRYYTLRDFSKDKDLSFLR